MAGTPLHHMVAATAPLPWTATVVTPGANLAARQGGRTARCPSRHRVGPTRRCVPYADGDQRPIAASCGTGTPPAGGAMGRAWAAWSSGGPTTQTHEPSPTARGVPGGRVAGSPVATGPAATDARQPSNR